MNDPRPTDLEFLSGGGHMGELIRAHSWETTPLGPPDDWPQGLRTALRILLTTQHPIFVFWGTERICFYNDAYSRSLGPEQHPSMLGQPAHTQWPLIWDVIGPQIEQVMSGGGSTWHENQKLPIERNGRIEDIYWTYSYGPIDEQTAPNNVGGVLVICTETTHQVLSEQRKDEFLAMLAHELRNPLAPIRNAAHILKRKFFKEKAAQAPIDMVHRQVTHLTRLVDDLLDVSRISQGRIELRLAVQPLSPALEQALETVAPMARDKSQRITLDSNFQPVWVNADRARLVQMFVNVLANAVKYTHPDGNIRVQVRTTEELVSVEVVDDGAGIASDLLPRVFDLFVQAERTLDRAQGGLGIGLSVVRKLVQMHGGEVTAHSEGLGKGARFEIRLPRCAAPTVADAEAQSSRFVKRRVLIVDDNEDAATSLAELLRFDGHVLESAFTARAALAKFESFGPDVVLLDIGLPEMDGYEVARRMRALQAQRPFALVALTGYGQASDRDRALDAGFDDHLVKPVDFDTLRRILVEGR
jgi:signal transduction histidine kinase